MLRFPVRFLSAAAALFLLSCAPSSPLFGADDFPYVVPDTLKRGPWRISVRSSGTIPYPKDFYGFNLQLAGTPFTYDNPTLTGLLGELKRIVARRLLSCSG